MEQVVLVYFAVAMDQGVEVAVTHCAAAPRHICVLWFCVARSIAIKRITLRSNNPLCSHSMSNAVKKIGLKETPTRFACCKKCHASLRLSCCDNPLSNLIQSFCSLELPCCLVNGYAGYADGSAYQKHTRSHLPLQSQHESLRQPGTQPPQPWR